jgi:hypothetical protein
MMVSKYHVFVPTTQLRRVIVSYSQVDVLRLVLSFAQRSTLVNIFPSPTDMLISDCSNFPCPKDDEVKHHRARRHRPWQNNTDWNLLTLTRNRQVEQQNCQRHRALLCNRREICSIASTNCDETGISLALQLVLHAWRHS